MPMTLDHIVDETRNLPADVVAELVDRILAEQHGGTEPRVAQAWKSETSRRIAEIESGQVQGVPGEEVSARLRQKLGQ